MPSKRSRAAAAAAAAELENMIYHDGNGVRGNEGGSNATSTSPNDLRSARAGSSGKSKKMRAGRSSQGGDNSEHGDDEHSKAGGSGKEEDEPAPLSDYKFIREGWGNKVNFMLSHGLEPGNPEHRAEVRSLIDTYRSASGAGVSPYRHAEPGDEASGSSGNSSTSGGKGVASNGKKKAASK